jgi:hypothetical protein
VTLARRTPLQRGAGLQRKAGLPPGRPLARHCTLDRRVPLARYQPLCAYTPLAPVSAKRAAANRRRRAVIAAKYPDRPLCVVPWCTNWADDVHEVLSRARGGAIDDPDIMAAVCRGCHNDITDEAAWAYPLGLLVHSWEAGGAA